MFGAFGNSAGLLLFACSVALKTLCSSIVFSLALTSRAGGVVINSRILGHNESPFLELCYTLLLAPQCQVHKRQFQPGYPQRQHAAPALARSSASVQMPGPATARSRILPIRPTSLPFCPPVSTRSPALLLPHNVHAFIETDTSMTTSLRAYNKMYAFEHTNTLTHKNNARYKTLP